MQELWLRAGQVPAPIDDGLAPVRRRASTAATHQHLASLFPAPLVPLADQFRTVAGLLQYSFDVGAHQGAYPIATLWLLLVHGHHILPRDSGGEPHMLSLTHAAFRRTTS